MNNADSSKISTPVARSLMAMQEVASTLKATARTIELQHDEVQRQYRQAARDAAKAHGRTGAVQEWIRLLHLPLAVTPEGDHLRVQPGIGYIADFVFALEVLHAVSTVPLVGNWNGVSFEVHPEHESPNTGLDAVLAWINGDR